LKNKNLIYLLMVLVAVSWGGAFNAAKFALADLQPFTVAFFRFGITAAILIPLNFSMLRKTKVEKRGLLEFFLLGLTGVFGYNAFFLTGMQFTSPVNGSLIVAASPIVTTLLAAPFLSEKITLNKLSGAALSFFGVALVVSGGTLYNLLTLQVNRGDALLLGGMLSWSIYAIVGKKSMGRYSPMITTTYGIAFGALLLLPAALLTDPGFGSLSGIGWPAATAVFYLAVIASVLAFYWWNQGVDKMGAGPASVFLNLIPVTTMIVSLFFREPVVLTQVAGCILVIAGVTLATQQLHRRPENRKGSVRPLADPKT
jgi:drug/metabolite transporter (DMT)-like permease